MRNLFNKIVIAVVTIFLFGCEDFFNPGSNSVLLEKDYIGSFTELYSGYMGIVAKVQAVADKSIFLEGLRGDFLEPTKNAPQDIWDVYNYAPDLSKNALADPKGYYAVIMNANDYIEHAIAYKTKNPNAIPDVTYRALISGAIRFKVWAYLMLAKIYGEAVYFEKPVKEYQPITNFPKYNLDMIIAKCIDLMETGVNGIDGKGVVKWSVELFPGMNVSSTEIEWDRICPSPECLLAELYLWQNNYQKAWENCKDQIVKGNADGRCYQINNSEYGGEWIGLSRQFFRKEHIAAAFYDYSKKQTNHVIQYFSNREPNLYYLKPTGAAINRFNTQKNTVGTYGDQYRGFNRTFAVENGDTILWKFLSLVHSDPELIYRNEILISLYRASDIYLMMCEALGGLHRFTEAYAFLNNGLADKYNPTTLQYNEPFNVYPASMHYGDSESDCQGIRWRASNKGLMNVGDALIATAMDSTSKQMLLDSLLLEETCLESAGESRSYYSMARMAKRWGTKFQKDWAAKVAAKYHEGYNKTSVKNNLETDLNKWFIKYELNSALFN
jgi:hypothetical protein